MAPKNPLEKPAFQIKVPALSYNTNFICLITKSYEKQAAAKALKALPEPISLESKHHICYNINNLTKGNPVGVRSGDEASIGLLGVPATADNCFNTVP